MIFNTVWVLYDISDHIDESWPVMIVVKMLLNGFNRTDDD